MKADRNDAPEAWLASRPRKNGNPGIVLAGVIGIVITLGALNVAGQAFKQTTVKSVAENRQQATITPIAEVARAEPVPAKDWDRIVEEQARRDAIPRQEPEQANNSEPLSQDNAYSTIRTTYREGLTTCSVLGQFRNPCLKSNPRRSCELSESRKKQS